MDNVETADIKIDTSIVARHSLLPLIKGHHRRKVRGNLSEPRASNYKFSSYNANIESPRQEVPRDFIAKSSSTEQPMAEEAWSGVPYSEEAARVRYLETKPECYVIFGKPGLDTLRLAESIAYNRQCVLVSASKIAREIDRCCLSREKVVWNRICELVNSATALHRGYVLEGLPILMNIDDEALKRPAECDLNYGCKANDSANTTERSSFMDELNCPCDQVDPCIGLSEPVTSSSCISCFSKTTSSSVTSLKRLINFADVTPDFQLYEIFQRWKLKPDIIIEYDCPNDEILALLENSYRSSPSISENAENESVILSQKFSDSNCSTVNVSSESCKCDLPSANSFTDDVQILNTRLKVYSKFAITPVKKIIYSAIPQNVIYVDGRYPVDHAIAVIKVKLQLMSCRVPLVPEHCDESQNLEDDAESLCEEANDNDECENVRKLKMSLMNNDDDNAEMDDDCEEEEENGPPMSGKTTLSQRFSNIYDFECISRDEAINYVLDNFDNSKLACDLREVFGRDGKPTALQFAKVVKLFLSNLQCVLQGCVFDGFPANEEETLIFEALDIQPIVVIDLEVAVGFLSERYETVKQGGIYSNFCQEYTEWIHTAKEFRESLKSNYNNLIAVDATMSKFGVWLRADEAVRFRCTKYFEYIGSTGTDVIRDVEFSCLPKSEILENGKNSSELYEPVLERMENRCMFFRQVANCMKNRPTLHHESTNDALPKMDYATRPLNEQTWELPRQSVQTVTFRRTSATEFVSDQEDI
ncbi:unnamed protein product [Trichogramma brassicae]|uniref:Uncharacterized protein n=1 Tax=Trichogramma brassicae TaxID=86971 RepID=A0A6H5J9R0_9HYME|nr:unnamed protein product [Trichogramma brassicae]